MTTSRGNHPSNHGPRRVDQRSVDYLTHHVAEVTKIVDLGWEESTDFGLGLAGLAYHLGQICDLSKELGITVAMLRDELDEPMWVDE